MNSPIPADCPALGAAAAPPSAAAGSAAAAAIGDVIFALVLAIVVTAADLHISLRAGLLANPPIYDGAAYVMDAQQLYRRHHGLDMRRRDVAWEALGTHAPLWTGLIWTHFEILGEGEWQAATVRFWPIFLLLLLVTRIVRRRSNGTVARCAAVWTAMLPIVSTGLRAAIAEAVWLGPSSGWVPPWYLSDLRPDFLFAVSLLWTVCLLIEEAGVPRRSCVVMSAAFAAAAFLTKPAAAIVFGATLGLTFLRILWLNRAVWRSAAAAFLPCVPVFLAALMPWALTGALARTVKYLMVNSTVGKYMAVDPDGTLITQFTFAWEWYGPLLGPEGWVVVAAGAWVVFRQRRLNGRIDARWTGYVLIVAAIYALSSATAIRNRFFGLPYYLALWVGSLAAIAEVLRSGRPGGTRWLVPSTLAAAAVVAGGGTLALRSRPDDSLTIGPENREAIRAMGADLRACVGADEVFLPLPGPGSPVAFRLYAMDDVGRVPDVRPNSMYLAADYAGPDGVDRFLREEVAGIRAVLAFDDNSAWPFLCGSLHRTHDFGNHSSTYPYLAAVGEWVRRPENGYVRLRTYVLRARWPLDRDRAAEPEVRRFTVGLYVRRRPVRSPFAGGIGDQWLDDQIGPRNPK